MTDREDVSGLPPHDPLFDGIATVMRVRRARLRLTQHAAAARAGLNPRHWGEIERGKKRPSVPSLAKIADALDISLPALIEEAIDDGQGAPATQPGSLPR